MSHRPALKHLAAGEGKYVPLAKVGFTFKAGAIVGSRYTLAEMSFPAGAEQPLHCHPWEETLYVLEGEIEMVGENGDCRVAGPGCVMHVPLGAAHGFTNVGKAAAKLLFIGPPAEEAFLDDFSAAVSGRENAESVTAVKARYGVENIEPIATRAR